MNRFSATVHSTGTVPAGRDRVWAVLTDPDALVAITPFLAGIETDGDTWRWRMRQVGALGLSLTPEFTESMRFAPMTRIDFVHAPPEGVEERTGTDGWYLLTDDGDRTGLEISVTVTVELPLPRTARGAVTRAMRATMTTIGERFATNLERRVAE